MQGSMRNGKLYKQVMWEHLTNAPASSSSQGTTHVGKQPAVQTMDTSVCPAVRKSSRDADVITANGSATSAANTPTHSTMIATKDAYIAGQTMFLTPSANEDAAGKPGSKMQRMLGNSKEVRDTGEGALSPAWVEWLMGFPRGFTNLQSQESKLESQNEQTVSDV